MNNKILELKHVTKRFGGIVAVNDCSLHVDNATIVGIIGPNGSGKTTLLNLINGIYKPDSGEIIFKGRIINGLSPSSIASLGIGRTFQIPRVFKKLTVLENLLVPTVYSNADHSEFLMKAKSLLRFFGLDHLANYYASELSGGQQKLVELARALMMDPSLLLLDEPTAGIHPDLKDKLLHYFSQLKLRGISIVIVSHDTHSVMKVCDKIIVMSSGSIICEGLPRDVTSNPKVIEAY
ncbi:MAG: ABC transporter ATP-binding protein, partial [Candidatus Bathyarchaeia archaeon]